jgi:hypothetical protein
LERGTPSLTRARLREVAPQLQGSESNRRAPTHEAGLGTSTRPAGREKGFEHAAGIGPALPAWKAGAYADRPRVR